ncbi:hypothetical protein KR084_009480, partial [Drosophila pseudotakahashii]
LLFTIQIFMLFSMEALAMSESQCGRLEEKLLFTTELKIEPTENSWLGILMEHQGGNKYENSKCCVTILNELHVLTTATCVRRFKNRSGETGAVAMVGVFDKTISREDELFCDKRGYCVPGPVLYNVVEIKVHPESNSDTGDNDLAILRLEEPIKWTQYIQPICMQGSSEPESLTNRYLHYTGFTESNDFRIKALAMTISRQNCQYQSSAAVFTPENQVCSYPVRNDKFYPGTALMDIDVQDEKPHSFYLVALLVKMVTGKVPVHIYQNVRPARRWILENSSTK